MRGVGEGVRDLEPLLGTRVSAQKGIVAGVLARPPLVPYDVLVADQGSSAGVSLGARAYGAGGTPLGTVESVTEHTSRVLLYSAPARQTGGWVGDTRIPVILIGEGAGAFSASLPRDAGVRTGDVVLVPGGGSLPIGVIEMVETAPSSPLAFLSITPITNPFSITWVTIADEGTIP